MEGITFAQFIAAQPSAPHEQPTDRYYFDLCNRLLETTLNSRLLVDRHPSVVARAMICLTGYYQDVISDAGPWHAFISECEKLYGWYLPFYQDDDYTPFELNLSDVRFMLWYALTMNDEYHSLTSPYDENIMQLGKILYDELERCYDESPMPEGYVFGRELEMHDPDDSETIMEMGNWLFLHCYLLTPAFSLTMSEIMQQFDGEKEPDYQKIHETLEEAMMECTTGPLALFLGEWIKLIVSGVLPPEPKEPADAPQHPYYTRFTEYTGGKTIAYFKDYQQLNRFFIDALGWQDGENHLESLNTETGFVAMVNPTKGILVARGVAKCIADPENPYYDKDYAREHAIDLLTERGRCPHDLLVRILAEKWLPDVHFPGDEAHCVQEYGDMIARCYLQNYYRGD